MFTALGSFGAHSPYSQYNYVIIFRGIYPKWRSDRVIFFIASFSAATLSQETNEKKLKR